MPEMAPPMPGAPGGAPGMPPGMPPKPPMVAPGSTAPATVAPQSDGLKMRAALMVGPAVKALEKALSLTGSQTDEGQTLMKVLGMLGKSFGSASGDLTRQEIKMLGEQAAPVTQPNRQAVSARLQQMGIGGGAPSPQPEAAPPGAGA